MERRTKRSDDPNVATRFYLESVAAQCKARAVALSTEDGLLVAGAGRDCDLDALAVIGTAAARKTKLPKDLIDGVTEGESLQIEAFKIDGIVLYLSALTKQKLPRAETQTTLGRIFGCAPLAV